MTNEEKAIDTQIHCPLAEFCRHNIDDCECGLDYEVCDGVSCPDYEVCDIDFN